MSKSMNVNSYTYYGTATTSSGSAAVSTALLPSFDSVDKIVVANRSSTDMLFIKTGASTVTTSFPTNGAAASSGTMLAPGTELSIDKDKYHTTFAIASMSGSCLYTVQYGDGK